MTVTKKVCDKCGKEIVSYPWQQSFPWIILTIKESLMGDVKTIDFCDQCKIDFMKWVEGANNAAD